MHGATIKVRTEDLFLFAHAKVLGTWTGRFIFVFSEVILLGETTAICSETCDYANYVDEVPHLCALNNKEIVAFIFIALAYTRMLREQLTLILRILEETKAYRAGEILS